MITDHILFDETQLAVREWELGNGINHWKWEGMGLKNTPCFRKKTSTHIIGYKLRNSCLILIIFDTKIPHIV